MFIKKNWLFLLSLMFSGCAVTIPDLTICATSGLMSAGADCVHTLKDEPSSLTLDQWLAFLEPVLESTDAAGIITPGRGAAICMADADFTKLKIAMEQACKLLGAKCNKEVTTNIAQVTGHVEKLQATVMGRRKKTKPLVVK